MSKNDDRKILEEAKKTAARLKELIDRLEGGSGQPAPIKEPNPPDWRDEAYGDGGFLVPGPRCGHPLGLQVADGAAKVLRERGVIK